MDTKYFAHALSRKPWGSGWKAKDKIADSLSRMILDFTVTFDSVLVWFWDKKRPRSNPGTLHFPNMVSPDPAMGIFGVVTGNLLVVWDVFWFHEYPFLDWGCLLNLFKVKYLFRHVNVMSADHATLRILYQKRWLSRSCKFNFPLHLCGATVPVLLPDRMVMSVCLRRGL